MSQIQGRGLCPQCGVPVWAAPPAEEHADVRAQIIAEGGNGRRHVCQTAVEAALAVAEVETIRATYVRHRPVELGPVREEIDWLALLGRTLPVEEVER